MTEQTIQLPQGTIAYRDEGEGPVIVLSHGIFVTGALWDGVVEHLLAEGFRCVRPEAPLGAHRIPMNPDADLSPPGVAEILAGLIEKLELGPVTLVGNDSGGAIAQMLTAAHPDLVSALVLTNCDALEVYPPVPFNLLPLVARLPGGIAALSTALRLRPLRWATYRPLTAKALPDALLREWMKPSRDPAIRQDIIRLLKGVEKHQAMEAAEALRDFGKPVLMPWGRNDLFFRLSLAERLAAYLPDARLRPIDQARTFVPLDQPEEVARMIVELHREPGFPAT